MEILLLIVALMIGVFTFNGAFFKTSDYPKPDQKASPPSDSNDQELSIGSLRDRGESYSPLTDFSSFIESLGFSEQCLNDTDRTLLRAAFKKPFQLRGKKIASITRYEKNGDETIFEICQTDLQSTRAILATKSARYKQHYGDVVTMVADIPSFCVPDKPTKKPRKNPDVNIETRTCECGAFTKYRHPFEFNDPRRLCSHLRKYFSDGDLLEGDHDLNKDEQEFLVDRMPTGRYQAKAIYVDDYRTIVIFKFDHRYYEQWLDVWAPKQNQKKDGSRNYDRFSYALREGRWSYGASPYQGPVIASLIETLFRLDDPLLLSQELPKSHPAHSITRAMYHHEEETLFRQD